jgi:LPS-assembly lipoprotein
MKVAKFNPTAALFTAMFLLAGCGFHLRGDIPGTTKDKTIFVSGTNSGSFYNSFTQALAIAGGISAAKSQDASAVVHIASARHIRRPITLSAIGRANMFDLTFRVIYDIQNPKGDILIPEQELNIRREYFNTQASPLGQGLEEVQLRQEMEQEAAQTLLRRVVFSLRDKNASAS